MTIDEEQLRELADARWAPTYRPPAEIAARAHALRRRRHTLRAGAAVTLAAAVTVGVVALRPADERAAPPQPAHGEFPFALACPAPAGPVIPLADVPQFVALPPDAQVTSLEAGRDPQECRLADGSLQVADDRRSLSGTFAVFESPLMALGPSRDDLPGRHERRVIAGVPVDLWWIDEPRRQMRAYWTALGRAYGAHADGFSNDESYLRDAVMNSAGAEQHRNRPDPDGLPYVRVGLLVPGAGAVELTVSDPFDNLIPPVGARYVAIPGNEQGYWWEEGGVGHLSWVNAPVDRPASARLLTGRGLTPERAAEIASSLRPTPLTDPRIPG